MVKMSLAILFLGVGLVACAGKSVNTWRMPENNDASQADPAAYGGDLMTFRKDMPHRPDPKPWAFYYKHCAINGDEVFYSKTSYDCTGPF